MYHTILYYDSNFPISQMKELRFNVAKKLSNVARDVELKPKQLVSMTRYPFDLCTCSP